MAGCVAVLFWAAVVCLGTRGVASTVPDADDGHFDGNRHGSCVCHQHCVDNSGGENMTSPLIVQLLSTLASTQTSQNDLLNRVVTQLHEEMQSMTSSLEAKMAEQGTLIGQLKEVVDSQQQQVAQLQTAVEGITPPTGYGKVYPVFRAAGHGGTYTLTLAAARALCEAKNAKLATLAQLQAAWDHGMNVCACGWLDDGSARYPMQWPRTGCGTGTPGLRLCLSPGGDPNSLFDVYCYQ